MGRIIACAIALAVVICGSVSASTNVAPLWNRFAGDYSFDSYPTSANATLGQSYHGSNFNHDLIGIVNSINQILAMPSFPLEDDDDLLAMPSFPLDDDDTLNATVENWPF